MGIDLPHFASLRSIRERRERLRPQPRPKTRVAFLGRLVAIKGVDLLLSALHRLQTECEIVIAGDGPERDALQAQAKNLRLDVKWLGELDAKDRDQLLLSADIIVMPSREDGGRTEGMPLVALEALASGAELVISDSGGLAEIPKSICHRVPAENIEALAAAIESIAQGQGAEFQPGHWLESHAWSSIAPRLLPGLSDTHHACRGA